MAQESSPGWELSLLFDIFDRSSKLGQIGVKDSPLWSIDEKRSSTEFSSMAVGACGATVRYRTVPYCGAGHVSWQNLDTCC